VAEETPNVVRRKISPRGRAAGVSKPKYSSCQTKEKKGAEVPEIRRKKSGGLMTLCVWGR
jgi:hypothetical protein